MILRQKYMKFFMVLVPLAVVLLYIASLIFKKEEDILLRYKAGGAEEKFIPEMKSAMRFLIRNNSLIDKIVNEDAQNKRQILSIVFPELIRYDVLKDVLERSSNYVSYINFGSHHTDFSVGYFQMKPSFIESLEEYVNNHEELCHWQFIVAEGNPRKSRKVRLDRLNRFDWQIIYAQCYWDIAEVHFKDVAFQSDLEKLRFYSAAYNFGFKKSIPSIMEWQDVKSFPYGSNYTKTQRSYSDFAADFYENYSCNIN